ncbi:hypothetical protein CHS0354_022615 [Potamilus streckersoni]|uniref:Calponin-homology (CH) domain-containing protein n=1 Tax=Potamilus streckersoni TaxID=2493646 RepID=A0AAE0VM19_9BIVA|nr:hypothetical protein CHS0354_022615 [Potamilus streckersoni]
MTDIFLNGNQTRLQQANNVQWVEIQRNTFKNWVNEQLKSRGLRAVDIRTDFEDGLYLIALVEILQRRKLQGVVEHPTHRYEKLHNITMALDAIAKDNVTIINIVTRPIIYQTISIDDRSVGLRIKLFQSMIGLSVYVSNYFNR